MSQRKAEDEDMSQKVFAKFRATSIVIFVMGVVSAGFAYSLQQRNGPQLRERKGFTLRTKTTAIPTIPRQLGPLESIESNATRYQKSDGTFKQVRTYFNAKGEIVKKEILFGIPGQGVFKINNPKGPLEFLSSMRPKEQTSYVRVNDGHSHPNFLRDAWVQGYQTYVLRFPEEDGGYFEMYCAPELDGQQLRTVSASPGGVSIEQVVEITIGDPDERVFGPLPSLLISYDHYKNQIALTQEAGNHEAAEGMKRVLNEQVAKEMKTAK